MARQEPLTEREVREALGLSHRAASLALAEAESWGIVERVPEPRRVGRRGPAGTAYLAVGDHWQWFGRVIAERKVREGDPIVAVLEAKEREAAAALDGHPDDASWPPCASGCPRSSSSSGCSTGRSVSSRSSSRASSSARSSSSDAIPDSDDPAAVRPPGRAPRRRRHRPRRGAVAPLADRRPTGHEADVGGHPDGRALISGYPRPMTEPRTDRPHVPGYGIPDTLDGTLPWSWAVERLERAIVYWLATTGADLLPTSSRSGAPGSDGRWYVEGGPTRWQRNLRENPQLAIQIEIGDEVVIVEGIATELVAPAARCPTAILAGYAKYKAAEDYEASADALGGGRPLGAHAGQGLRLVDFPADMTRFRFGTGCRTARARSCPAPDALVR